MYFPHVIPDELNINGIHIEIIVIFLYQENESRLLNINYMNLTSSLKDFIQITILLFLIYSFQCCTYINNELLLYQK